MNTLPYQHTSKRRENTALKAIMNVDLNTGLRPAYPGEQESFPASSSATVTTRCMDLYPGFNRRDHFVVRLRELIEKHISDETYDISRLCRDFGASRTQIHKKLAKWTGLSTSRFIRMIRLRKAKALLLDTDLNISEVAYEVGFKDSHYFSRVFSISFQMCPREFRRRIGTQSLTVVY